MKTLVHPTILVAATLPVAASLAIAAAAKAEPVVSHSSEVRKQKRQRHLQLQQPTLASKAFAGYGSQSLVQSKDNPAVVVRREPRYSAEDIRQHNREYISQITNTHSWEEFIAL